MREIKFRLFGKEHQIMYSWEEILDFHSLKDTLKYGGEETEYYSPLLQYTGLSDKYGQEIYEGDILRGPKYYESEESTSPVYDQWKVTYKNCSFYLGYSPIEEDLDWIGNECEVVGNIYENAELIEV